MGDVYKKTKEIMEQELWKLMEKEMTPTNLELTYKVIDVLKDIEEICGSDHDGYEDEYSGRNYSRRRSRNHPYVEDTYIPMNSYARNYQNMPSRTSSIIPKLQKLINESSNDHERMMIQSILDELM